MTLTTLIGLELRRLGLAGVGVAAVWGACGERATRWAPDAHQELLYALGCVAALWLLFFAALGNFSFGGTVRQIENFASRYVAASAERQDHFSRFFWLTSAGLFVAVGFFRRHSLTQPGGAATSHSREMPHG